MPHHGQLVHSPTTNINITIINRKMPPINLVFMSYQFKILSNHLIITLCALILLLTAIICMYSCFDKQLSFACAAALKSNYLLPVQLLPSRTITCLYSCSVQQLLFTCTAAPISNYHLP